MCFQGVSMRKVTLLPEKICGLKVAGFLPAAALLDKNVLSILYLYPEFRKDTGCPQFVSTGLPSLKQQIVLPSFYKEVCVSYSDLSILVVG